jgi:outer membrane lipoprotein-sorting protein
MHKLPNHTLLALGLLAFAPLVATADRKPAAVETTKPLGAQASEAVTLETIVLNHVTALGGEKLLRSTKTFGFTVSGEKAGKKFTKTVHQARPNLMRVDITSDDGPMSKGFDGKVAWIKKGTAAAEMLSPEDTKSMQAHASFDEPLLDYATKGTKVKLVGKSEVAKTPAYDLELTFASGEVEHHFLDAKSFLLLKRTFTSKDKDGKAIEMSVRFGDYKKVAGRAINHSIEWDYEGKTSKSVVSNITYDKKLDAKLFAMPK